MLPLVGLQRLELHRDSIKKLYAVILSQKNSLPSKKLSALILSLDLHQLSSSISIDGSNLHYDSDEQFLENGKLQNGGSSEVVGGDTKGKKGLPAKNLMAEASGHTISGLSAAYELKLQGLNVTVFEADDRAGGKLRSISHNGFIWDEGANTMTETETAVGFLLDTLGLRDKQQYPLSQNKRYIAKNGVPVMAAQREND